VTEKGSYVFIGGFVLAIAGLLLAQSRRKLVERVGLACIASGLLIAMGSIYVVPK
jgi:hypothetical protein